MGRSILIGVTPHRPTGILVASLLRLNCVYGRAVPQATPSFPKLVASLADRGTPTRHNRGDTSPYTILQPDSSIQDRATDAHSRIADLEVITWRPNLTTPLEDDEPYPS